MPCSSCKRNKITPAELGSRNDLGLWLNVRNLLGEGVEVGVLRGEFSDRILATWQGRKLHLVDPWRHFESGYIDGCNVSDADQELNYLITKQRMLKHPGRAELHRCTSVEASAKFADGSLDWAYIDGAHDYQNVTADLEAWWPKVRNGGVLSGHDWKLIRRKSYVCEVPQAVEDFLETVGLSVHEHIKLTTRDRVQSWWVEKR